MDAYCAEIHKLEGHYKAGEATLVQSHNHQAIYPRQLDVGFYTPEPKLV
jgi:hypothetical protein